MWANPVVSPLTTRMPAPRSRPLVTCSMRPSSSAADRGPLVLGEHLGELAAGAHRRAEHPFEYVGFDYISSGHPHHSTHCVVNPAILWGAYRRTVAKVPAWQSAAQSTARQRPIDKRWSRLSRSSKLGIARVVALVATLTACNPAEPAKQAKADIDNRQRGGLRAGKVDDREGRPVVHVAGARRSRHRGSDRWPPDIVAAESHADGCRAPTARSLVPPAPSALQPRLDVPRVDVLGSVSTLTR